MTEDRRQTRGKVQNIPALPHQLTRGVQKSQDNAIRAIQGNFDHIMGLFEEFESKHNELVDIVDEIAQAVEDISSLAT